MRALQLGARSLAMRRAAGFAIDKSSTFSRMSAYRNDFDEQIKQKYIRNQVKDQQFAQMDPAHIKKAISEEYEKAKEEIFQDGGVLTELRKTMLGKDEDKSKEKLGEEEFEDPVDNFLHEGLTHDEFLYRASNIQKQIFAKQIPDFFEKDEINSQYGNYSSYDRNYAKLRSVKKNLDEIGQEGFAAYKLQRYTNLQEEGQRTIEDDEDLDEVDEILEETGVEMNEDEKSMLRWKLADIVQQENDAYVPYFEEMEGENEKDPFEENDDEDGRLSPEARDDIYQLYQKGWSIKDICTRYGIIPERAKAVIWSCDKYFFQILPKADPLLIHMADEAEEEWEEEHGWQDYGIDLEELAEREKGLHTISFKKTKEVDVQNPSKNIMSEVEYEVIQKRRVPREEKIILKLDGGLYQHGYLIKEWIVNRGRGRRDVTRQFRNIVRYSHDPSKLPLYAQLRLNQGPRVAARGYGSRL